jgi:hypothetical protein
MRVEDCRRSYLGGSRVLSLFVGCPGYALVGAIWLVAGHLTLALVLHPGFGVVAGAG